jgi:hypothetical protein
MSLQQRT